MKPLILFVFLLSISTTTNAAQADVWPKLDPENASQQSACADALRIANNTFHSDALLTQPVIPDDLGSKLVLDVLNNASLVNVNIFNLEAEASTLSVYVQKTTTLPYRFVLLGDPIGWRGDQYSLYTVDEKVDSEQIISKIHEINEFAHEVISARWTAPLIFSDQRTADQLWVIKLGEPYETMGDWQIYVGKKNGMVERCKVRFRPDDASPVKALPSSVRELAELLDQTTGSGEDEGTYQQTARLKINISQTWGSAAFRPWAIGTAYNTRSEVDAGLKAWAGESPENEKIYQNILQQYPVAEQALADYYESHFKRSEEEAKNLAVQVLDIALRSYFVFHSDLD